LEYKRYVTEPVGVTPDVPNTLAVSYAEEPDASVPDQGRFVDASYTVVETPVVVLV
jgi:hypothetical protein